MEFQLIEPYADNEPPHPGLPLEIGSTTIPADPANPEFALSLQTRGRYLLVGRDGVDELYDLQTSKLLWSTDTAQALIFWPPE